MQGCIEFIRSHNRINHFYTNLINAYMQIILMLLLERLELHKKSDGRNLNTLELILRWVNAHYTEPITVESTAAALQISESTISHLLAERLHIGFRTYVNLLRIQAAKQLLITTENPIGEIAFDCGFGSFASFNRIFKSETGITPREFRMKGQTLG